MEESSEACSQAGKHRSQSPIQRMTLPLLMKGTLLLTVPETGVKMEKDAEQLTLQTSHAMVLMGMPICNHLNYSKYMNQNCLGQLGAIRMTRALS